MQLKECEEYKVCERQLLKEFKKLLNDFNENEIIYIIKNGLKYIKTAS